MYKLLLAFCFIFISFTSLAQKEALPKDHPISLAAPHLPLFSRFQGEGRVFHGENYTYNTEKNENSIRQWIKNYSNEVKAYKEAILNYIKAVDISTLPENEKEVYYDLKSQWFMISQIN